MNERERLVFEKYARLRDMDDTEVKRDYTNYDMSQRLRLADIVAGDGHRTIIDLGSQQGGMTHALKECGLAVTSTENYYRRSFFDTEKEYLENYRKHFRKHFTGLRKVNDDIVCCDAFKPPFKGVDALVSYMFLGMYLPGRLRKGGLLRKGRTVNDIFEELSKSADIIYSVELKSEYASWFGCSSMEYPEIYDRLSNVLPGFEIDYLGSFGMYTAESSPEERIGFKFTKKF